VSATESNWKAPAYVWSNSMAENNREYYQRRLETQRKMAADAAHPGVRKLHETMATAYSRIIEKMTGGQRR
jgi:hypothetical protein